MKKRSKNILVAPLNWGLGHATRCIPIIQALEDENYNPIIASDGASLELLKKEFPHLLALELPSYNIEYAKNGVFFKWKIIKQLPKIIQAVRNEQKTVESWAKKHQIAGVISDNRLGVYAKKAPSVFITHQLNILSGNTSWIVSKIHIFFIKKFDICWVPDIKSKPNLTGKLGHLKKTSLNIKYIRPLSRFQKKEVDEIYDLMVLLSGPEPQRTMLEEKLVVELKNYNGNILFVKGLIDEVQKVEKSNQFTIYNFMTSDELELALNQSKMVLCRSGYTTIMDLAKIQKKAFFIPTPGQFEQEYLAERFKKKRFLPYAKQDDFKVENLQEVQHYKGIQKLELGINWPKLFTIFE